MSKPNHEIASEPVIRQLDWVIAPAAAPSERTSGVKISSRAFWMTIARPNVVSSGTSGPPRRLRASSASWSR